TSEGTGSGTRTAKTRRAGRLPSQYNSRSPCRAAPANFRPARWSNFSKNRFPASPPFGSPKDRVQTLRDVMPRAFADPRFSVEHRKSMGDDPAPLGGEGLERAVKDLQRAQEVSVLSQKNGRRRCAAAALRPAV